MPTYTLKNKNTNEQWDVIMTYSEMKEYVQKNPEIDMIIGTPSFIGGVSTDSGRLPEGFKDRMRERKKKHPTSKAVDHLI